MSMKKKRKCVTNEEVLAISNHLAYEMMMLSGLVKELNESSGEGVIHNSLVESFAIHSRNLIDFLWSHNPQFDDVVADYFFEDPYDWIKYRPKKSELLSKVSTKVNKQVAHLTFSRLKYDNDNKGWAYGYIANELIYVLTIFLERASFRLLDESCRKLLRISVQKSKFVRVRIKSIWEAPSNLTIGEIEVHKIEKDYISNEKKFRKGMDSKPVNCFSMLIPKKDY